MDATSAAAVCCAAAANHAFASATLRFAAVHCIHVMAAVAGFAPRVDALGVVSIEDNPAGNHSRKGLIGERKQIMTLL